MADQARGTSGARLTERGRATRDRILKAAADMVYVRGVAATTLDDVRTASGTSKSQLYRHYPDKDALMRDVVELRAAEVLERNRQFLANVKSVRGLERWRDALVEGVALRGGAHGCPLGSLAGELADQDEGLRVSLAQHFAEWEELLRAGLERMRTAGLLRPEADPAALATGLLAAVQGGYLLAQTTHDAGPMRIALDMAIDRVRSFTSEPKR